MSPYFITKDGEGEHNYSKCQQVFQRQILYSKGGEIMQFHLTKKRCDFSMYFTNMAAIFLAPGTFHIPHLKQIPLLHTMKNNLSSRKTCGFRSKKKKKEEKMWRKLVSRGLSKTDLWIYSNISIYSSNPSQSSTFPKIIHFFLLLWMKFHQK